jgi:hypothetical protein
MAPRPEAGALRSADKHAETATASQARQLLAQTIAKPGTRAQLLDAENHKTGETSIETAAESDMAFFIVVRAGVLAVDFDCAGADTAARQLYASLRVHGHHPVLTASGQSGRRHLLCWLDADDFALWAATAKQLGGDVRTTIRPPLARHRNGTDRSELMLIDGPVEAARRLSGRLPNRPLREDAIAAIDGTRTRGDNSRSGQIHAAACGAVNAGWAEAEFESLVRTPGTPIHEAFAARERDDGSAATATWLSGYVWPEAVEFVAASPARRTRSARRLRPLFAQAFARTWPGRAGPAQLAVYLALLVKYAWCGREVFDASTRELGETAGISSRRTVDSALVALVDAGLVEQVRPAKSGASPAWRLVLDRHPQDEDDDLPVHAALRLLPHDVFRNKVGLGKLAQQLHMIVNIAGTTTIDQLTTMTGHTERTIRQHVGLLVDHGLLDQVDGQLLRGDADLDQVAEHLGASGRGHQQRLLHERERLAYRSPSTAQNS